MFYQKIKKIEISIRNRLLKVAKFESTSSEDIFQSAPCSLSIKLLAGQYILAKNVINYSLVEHSCCRKVTTHSEKEETRIILLNKIAIGVVTSTHLSGLFSSSSMQKRSSSSPIFRISLSLLSALLNESPHVTKALILSNVWKHDEPGSGSLRTQAEDLAAGFSTGDEDFASSVNATDDLN